MNDTFGRDEDTYVAVLTPDLFCRRARQVHRDPRGGQKVHGQREKDQKIELRNKKINSLNKKINALKDEMNILKDDNDKLVKSVKFLNSKIEMNLAENENIKKQEIEQLNSLNFQLEKEKKEIKKEYKNIANQNLKLNLQLKTLEEKLKKFEENILYLEHLVDDQKDIISKFESITFHH